MKLKLGNVYLTGGPKGQETLTLAFWDEDSRGSPYKYVRLPFKMDMSVQEVEVVLLDSLNAVADLIDESEDA